MSSYQVYPHGDLRVVLRQRATEAEPHQRGAARDRILSIIRAIDNDEDVTVTLRELQDGLWHSALINADQFNDLHNDAAPLGAMHYVVDGDGNYEPVVA